MSKKTFATLSLMLLLVATPIFAERPLHATIPFDFRVGNTLMTAGDYTVKFLVPGTVIVQRADYKAACAVITMAVQSNKTPDVGKLVFNRYGNSHFLSQIWSPGYGQGRQVHKSKVETELARIAGASQMASVRIQAR